MNSQISRGIVTHSFPYRITGSNGRTLYGYTNNYDSDQ